MLLCLHVSVVMSQSEGDNIKLLKYITGRIPKAILQPVGIFFFPQLDDTKLTCLNNFVTRFSVTAFPSKWTFKSHISVT